MSNLISNSNQSNQRQRAGAISCPFLYTRQPLNTITMNNTAFTPYQRNELKGMTNAQLVSLIRTAAENFPDTSLILTPRIDRSRDNRTRLRASSEQGDRGLRTLIPHRRFAGARGHRQLQSRPRHDKGNRLAPVPPVPTYRIRPDRKGLHQSLQRQDIPEPQTDIPPRKHSLLAGNKGCVLGAATVRATHPYKEQGEAPI